MKKRNLEGEISLYIHIINKKRGNSARKQRERVP